MIRTASPPPTPVPSAPASPPDHHRLPAKPRQFRRRPTGPDANILIEAEQSLTEPHPPPQVPGRLLYPRSNLIIRRERLPNGYRLTFTGEEASGMMMDSVLDQIERMYAPV